LPCSTSSIIAGVVAMTFVREAKSQIVLSAVTAALPGFQVKCP
jgi:hypothetical protein